MELALMTMDSGGNDSSGDQVVPNGPGGNDSSGDKVVPKWTLEETIALEIQVVPNGPGGNDSSGGKVVPLELEETRKW